MTCGSWTKYMVVVVVEVEGPSCHQLGISKPLEELVMQMQQRVADGRWPA